MKSLAKYISQLKTLHSLNEFIDEKLIINKNSNIVGITYKYHPKTREELIEILSKLCDYDNEIYMKNYILDVSNIDVSNINDFSNIFLSIDNASYVRMKKLIISGWDTSSATNMCQMFGGLLEVEEIIGIDELNVSNVIDMSWMFAQCTSLKKIDLSKWNVKKCKDFSYMFCGCRKIEHIGNIEGWKIDHITDTEKMFSGCKKLNDIPSWWLCK